MSDSSEKPARSRRRVLGIGRAGGSLPDLDPVLESFYSELYLAPAPLMGLEMLGSLGPVDLIIVEHPLDGMSLEEFQTQVKEICDGPARVAVLVEMAALDTVRGSNMTDLILLPFERSVEDVEGVLSMLLTRAPRYPVRLMVRLESGAGLSRLLRVAQTEDISRTGMLLRTQQELPEDAMVRFSFHIPDDSHPISGTASVVRTIAPIGDRPQGIAIHFQELLPSDEQRLDAFLEELSADPTGLIAE